MLYFCLFNSQKAITTTTTTTTNPNPTTTTPVTENNFCKDKKDGLYAHPDCAKYYQCYHSGTTAFQSCPAKD